LEERVICSQGADHGWAGITSRCQTDSRFVYATVARGIVIVVPVFKSEVQHCGVGGFLLVLSG